jgi:hypothetical protein
MDQVKRYRILISAAVILIAILVVVYFNVYRANLDKNKEITVSGNIITEEVIKSLAQDPKAPDLILTPETMDRLSRGKPALEPSQEVLDRLSGK